VNLGSAADVAALVTLATQNWLGGVILGLTGALLGVVHVVRSLHREVTRSLVVAVVGAALGGAVFGVSLSQLIQPGTSASQPPSAAHTGGSTSATTSPAKTTPSGSARSGEVLLSGDRLDFDQDPPRLVQEGDLGNEPELLFYKYLDKITLNGQTSAAHWEADTTPAQGDCVDVLNRLDLGRGYEFPKFQNGRAFCLRTSDGRIAFVRVKNGSSDGYLLSYTVWEK
jgi:uncharacterized membrane protein YeaQ/YmgE (transglycosylase-associated protein family)